MVTTRGFDLANYFWEHCSDYDRAHNEIPDASHYPSIEEANRLITLYLQSLGKNDNDSRLYQDLIGRLRQEIEAHLPFVHLQWAHWGLIKAGDRLGKKPGSFDYLKYAHDRFKRFFSHLAK